MDFKVDDASKRGVLTLAGDLNIQEAARLKEHFVEALERVDHCVLNLDKVISVDITGIQLLYSACKTAAASNKQLTLEGECPAVFRKAVAAAGYAEHEWLCFG